MPQPQQGAERTVPSPGQGQGPAFLFSMRRLSSPGAQDQVIRTCLPPALLSAVSPRRQPGTFHPTPQFASSCPAPTCLPTDNSSGSAPQCLDTARRRVGPDARPAGPSPPRHSSGPPVPPLPERLDLGALRARSHGRGVGRAAPPRPFGLSSLPCSAKHRASNRTRPPAIRSQVTAQRGVCHCPAGREAGQGLRQPLLSREIGPSWAERCRGWNTLHAALRALRAAPSSAAPGASGKAQAEGEGTEQERGTGTNSGVVIRCAETLRPSILTGGSEPQAVVWGKGTRRGSNEPSP